MDRGVRETLCSSCCHKYICAYKDVYLNMVNSLQEIFYKFPKNERKFIYLKDPTCTFYSKEFGDPKPLTMGTNLTEKEFLKTLEDGRKLCAKLIAEAVSEPIRIHHTNPITMDDMRNADGKIGV